jgi:hypothetical protein
MSIYFEYQSKVPLNKYHYIVEVAQKDAKGVRRSPIELRIAAASVLLNGLSVAPEGVLTPVEIGKSLFDEATKEQIFLDTDGAIYNVIQETSASP